MTRNLYAIKNRAGGVICHQVATTERQAIEFARMHGHRSALSAEFVREN